MPDDRSGRDVQRAAGAEPQPDLYPLVVEPPDFHIIAAGLSLPHAATFHLAGFAAELRCWADNKVFSAATRMAPQSFIPSGTFKPRGGRIEPPQARAIFSGFVRSSELRTNPVTGIAFRYLTVDTVGGSIDVVADQDVISGQPVIGGIAHGSFWLTGRPEARP